MLQGLKKLTGDFYDPTRLLSYLGEADKGGRFVAMAIGARSMGKSTSIASALLLDWKQRGSRFMLCRGGQGSKDAIDLTAPSYCETSNALMREAGYDINVTYKAGTFYDGEEVIGYAAPLVNTQKYKSIVLSTPEHPIRWLVLDEFISEDNTYLKNEADKFQRFFTTLSRYKGCPYNNDLRIIMLANNVSKYSNPYFQAMGVDKYIGREKLNFIAPKNEYWALEFVNSNDVKAIAKAKESNAYRFASDSYKKQAFDNDANTDLCFIEKINCPKKDIFDFRFDGVVYTFSLYRQNDTDMGYIYKGSCYSPNHYAITQDDHTPDRYFLQNCKTKYGVLALKLLYDEGRCRFASVGAKVAVDYWFNYID